MVFRHLRNSNSQSCGNPFRNALNAGVEPAADAVAAGNTDHRVNCAEHKILARINMPAEQRKNQCVGSKIYRESD